MTASQAQKHSEKLDELLVKVTEIGTRQVAVMEGQAVLSQKLEALPCAERALVLDRLVQTDLRRRTMAITIWGLLGTNVLFLLKFAMELLKGKP